MFLMPYVRKFTKNNLPIGVILLVLINVLVYFGPQSRDKHRYEMAYSHYADSILPKVELPRYHDYLKAQGNESKSEHIAMLISQQQTRMAASIMQRDDDFMNQLRDNRVVTPQDGDFERWQRERAIFDERLGSVFVERFKFKTDDPTLLTALTHQFLHGNLSHLAGNMLVLILIAPAIEALIGTRRFLLCYVVSGLGAAAAFWLWHMHGEPTSVVGASGAIAGAMGMFAVLFGMRRISFFYFFFLYFDVIQAPALLALPIWIVNEAVQLLWLDQNHVAYDAHLGGIICGAAIACLWRALAREKLSMLDVGADSSSPKKDLLSKARREMEAQRFESARLSYLDAARATQDCDILRECWNVISLASAASPEYHRIAAIILRLKSMTSVTSELVILVFSHYVKNADPIPRIDADTLAMLAKRFIHMQRQNELELVLRLLSATMPAHPLRAELTRQAMMHMIQAGDKARATALQGLL